MVKSYFGKVDRKGHREDGEITSQYPAWMHDKGIDDLNETIGSIERSFVARTYRPEDKGYLDEKLKKCKERLALIEEGKPQFNDQERDKLAKYNQTLGKNISESMFTYSEMHLKMASPQEELKRQKYAKKISVNNEEARACGIKISDDGKLARDAATKVWKIQRRALGESDNPEILRKPGLTAGGRRNRVGWTPTMG